MRLTLPAPSDLLRAYLWLVGTILFIQGILTVAGLALFGREASEATFGYLNRDTLHGLIHIAWGALMLALLRGRAGERTLRRLALAFSLFYLALTLLGLLVHHPFGIYLGPYEHIFHFIIGTPALALWLATAGPNLRLARLARSGES